MKIRTYGIKELSEKIQVELFRLGYKWGLGGANISSSAFHLLYTNHESLEIAHGLSDHGFDSGRSKEVTLRDLIDMGTPVKKVKYYRWRVKSDRGSWYIPTHYLSENGCYADGDKMHDWDSKEKVKLNEPCVEI